MVKCPRCLGTKKVAGLGFMQTQCEMCKGNGFVTEEASKEFYALRAKETRVNPIYSGNPKDTVKRAEDKLKEKLKDANVAFKHKAKQLAQESVEHNQNNQHYNQEDKPAIETKHNQTPNHKNQKTYTEAQLNRIKSQIVERDNSIMQSQAQALKQLEDDLNQDLQTDNKLNIESIEDKPAQGIATNDKTKRNRKSKT